MKNLLPLALLLLCFTVQSQVKIGDNPTTINANSLLELESTNKGFLPPRVALNDASSIAPLTGTVPSGMMVYSSGGTLADGYYYWNGTYWRLVATSGLNAVAKTASATLLKTETMVLASNDITLTLPVVTASDNGLALTVKNSGTHTDLITVKGSAGATVDGKDNSYLTRWFSKTYIAYNGNWLLSTKETGSDNLYDVSPEGSWTTIEEILEYLGEHMSGPSVVRFTGTFAISATQVIDLPHPVTFQGSSYSKATFEAASGLSGSPMFRCLSEAYFKMLQFDGSTLGGYGNSAGDDAIQLETGGEYFEVKDCNFNQFNKAIVAESNVELWLFETDINNAVAVGVDAAAGVTSGLTLKTSETDFINCGAGIRLLSGDQAVISILNCSFYNQSGQTGLIYTPATFTNFSSMFITNNAWNNVGTFSSGFDFTRTDGRDSKVFLQNNSGDGDKNPSCHINVLNSNIGTTLTTGAVWYKALWDQAVTTVSTTMWTVLNDNLSSTNVNRITYQPANKRGGTFFITGNLSVNQSSRTISLAIVKKGVTGVRYGETTIRTGTSNTPTLFSTVVHFSEIAANDYFEIYCSSANNNDVIKLHDVQWFADTK